MRIVRHIVMAAFLLSGAYRTASSQTVDCRPEALELSVGRLKQMPYVVGCSYDPVNAILRRYEPRIQKQVVAGSQPDGQITKQSPDPGEPFTPRMLIVLSVSDGSVSGIESPSSQVSPLADLSVTGTVDTAGPYRPGQTVTFSMYVRNAGPAIARGIQISEVPTNLTIQKVYGGCTAFPCSLVDLNPDFTASISMTAVIMGEGPFRNSVSATFSGLDSNLSNNSTDFGGNSEAEPGSDTATKRTTKKSGTRRPDETAHPSDHVDVRWYSQTRVQVLVIVGLLGAFTVLTRKLHRRRWRSKTAVSAFLEGGTFVGTCELLSFGAPPIQMRAVLERGHTSPVGRVLIVREEVLHD